MSDLSIRTISTDEHAAYIATQPSASFLQTPGWAAVKSEWKAESLGWYDASNPSELLGVGLVLYRQMPKVKRYLAYLPEGPVIDWDAVDLGRYLRPLAAHLQQRGRVRRPDGPAGARRGGGARRRSRTRSPAVSSRSSATSGRT